MNNTLTDITILIDRSGSMASRVEDTKGGFATLVADQRKAPGEARLSLIQFDDSYEVNYVGLPINGLTPALEYMPRGSTALLDAIGRTIIDTGKRLAALPEHDRPGKVMLVIITDGLENASQEYSRAHVNRLIAHQRDVYKWIVLFMGTNQDAIAEAAALGIQPGYAITYAANAAGTAATYDIASDKMLRARASSNAVEAMCVAAFTSEDRQQAAGDDATWVNVSKNVVPTTTTTTK